MIDPLRMVGGELLVSFVVGGADDQVPPVNGSALANLLQVEGPSLAMLLSNEVIGVTVLYSLVLRLLPAFNVVRRKLCNNSGFLSGLGMWLTVLHATHCLCETKPQEKQSIFNPRFWLVKKRKHTRKSHRQAGAWVC